jgi:type III secretion system FlhB-like substrate exporter
MQSVQQMSGGAQKLQGAVAVEKVRGQNKLQQVAAKGQQDLQNTIVEKAIEKIGPTELAQAEGRLSRNTDMQELQTGIGA